SSDSWMLFTREFYSLVHSKLREDGVFIQWIPIHNLEVYDFTSILKTVRSVFSNVSLMVTGTYTLVLTKKGKFEKLEIFSKDFGDLKTIGIADEDTFKSLVLLSPELFNILVEREKGEILSDLKSSVEFAEFHRRVAEDTKVKNLKLILKYSTPLELSKFTDTDPKKHYSMILANTGLVDYWDNLHYEALKKLDKSLELDPKNFYSRFLFHTIFPNFVELVYKYETQIKERYGEKVYQELVEYIRSKIESK
ncbi:MAG: hypothetical protein ABDH28_02825, partial [Brevinematia bacterium]